ncbi:hypothetical protein Tco_0910467 [Tanacetum coccineum]|uniref:Uncharacterized protein n=1 Tax=Tanacetum coccineum TaxID=301880 RepID=A0ABQ5CUM1_9ASTR
MCLNLWSYKVVRHRYSNPMILPEPEGSTQGYPLVSVEVLREHAEYDESNTYVLERFNTTAGNPVNEILLKLNLPDHRPILTDSKVTPTKHGRMTKPYSSLGFIANCFIADSHKDGHGDFRYSDTVHPSKSNEVLKLKNIKKDASLKLFKLTNQERYEHVGPKVTSSQDGKVYKMGKRDYAWLMISRSSRSPQQDFDARGDYDDDYQGDTFQNDAEDTLTSAMMLLSRAITQRYSTPTNNCLRSSSNTRNQAVVQADRVDIQSKNVGNDGRNARRSFNAQEESVEGSNIQKRLGMYKELFELLHQEMLQMFSATIAVQKVTMLGIVQSKEFGILSTSWSKCCLQRRTEAEVVLSNEQNDFLIAAQMEEIEELSVNICMMAKFQPANIDSDEGPSYDSAFISELMMEAFEHDKNAHDSYDNGLEQLARSAYKEAEKQQILAQKVKQQNVELTKQLEQYKKRVRVFETNNANKTNFHKEFIEADHRAKRIETEFQTQFIHDRDKIRALEKERDDLQLNVSIQRKQILELKSAQTSLKCKLNANEDKYLDDVMNLEAKQKKNENVVMKMSNYLQALFMLGPKPLSVYDPQLKRGLGYENHPYDALLKQSDFLS